MTSVALVTSWFLGKLPSDRLTAAMPPLRAPPQPPCQHSRPFLIEGQYVGSLAGPPCILGREGAGRGWASMAQEAQVNLQVCLGGREGRLPLLPLSGLELVLH